MQVIFRGMPPKERTYVVTCPACKSVIRYKGSEVLRRVETQRDGITHELGNCVVCNERRLFNYNPKEEQPGATYPKQTNKVL